MLHGSRGNDVIDEIERTADDVLLPLRGATLRSALTQPAPTRGIELRGRGLAFSAAKPSEDGRWLVLRCVNLTDAPVQGSWRVERAITEAHLARLDETIIGAATFAGSMIDFSAPPFGIVTLLVV
jgi:hypothetical protein